MTPDPDPPAAADQPAACADDPGLVLPAAIARRARTDADRPFLVDVAGGSLSYQQTWQGVGQRAAALARLGVAAGETVASFLPQSIESHLLWLADALVGARHVPVNPQLRGEFLAHVLRDAGVRRAFARTDQLPALREAGLPAGIEVIEVAAPGSAQPAAWDRAVAAAPAAAPPAHAVPEAGDVATVIYTSGTTGPAKGVLVTWGQIANAIGLRPRHLLGPADAYFMPWPAFHVMGLTPLAIMADAGGRVVLRDRPSISSFWKDVDLNGCTCATIGPIARLLMDRPRRDDDARHALRSVVMGPVIPDVDVFRERFGIDVMTVYGSSEIAYPLVSRHVDGTNRHLVGKLRTGYLARVVDASLRDVPDGSAGELLVRPPAPCLASPGYLGQPELTRRAWADGYFRTGDAFVRYPNGSFEFIDRLHDTIRRFGENVSSAFLESVIMKEDGVLECAVVGVPSAAAGQEIHLAVVPSAGVTLDPEAFAARLRTVLPRYLVPAFVSIWAELPKTPNGKIRKVELRRAGVPPGAWRGIDRASGRSR